MFPKLMGCDTTFGVTRQQRNLFLFARIDGNDKVLTVFHYCMPSKEARAYHWSLRSALPHLLTEVTLSHNKCIATDQEYTMYRPLRSMMDSFPCLSKSRHRLDTYHLLNKEWKDKVVLKVSGNEAIKPLDSLLGMFSALFDYVETEDEMKSHTKRSQRCYSSIKTKVKSEYAQRSIEQIFNRIQNNLIA